MKIHGKRFIVQTSDGYYAGISRSVAAFTAETANARKMTEAEAKRLVTLLARKDYKGLRIEAIEHRESSPSALGGPKARN